MSPWVHSRCTTAYKGVCRDGWKGQWPCCHPSPPRTFSFSLAAPVARIHGSTALPKSQWGETPISKQAHGMDISCFPEGLISCRLSDLHMQPLWGFRWLGCTWRMMFYSIEGKKGQGQTVKTSPKARRISVPQLYHLSCCSDTMKAAK